MEINTKLNAADALQTQMQVDSFNKTLAVNGRTASQQLGNDDFLKLRITQLAHQDPLSPMENTEFIAQMAQFSSLEQITNMSTGFTRLASMLNNSEASSVIGKTVDIVSGETRVTGTVEAAVRGEKPQVVVNGVPYETANIERIYAE